jgi:N-methylhydantoinase A
VEAVAVCFLHSWSNPIHEKQMGAILAEVMPDAYLTLSHQILREYGEYERISTSVVNAYIGPRVRGYLDGLERSLAELKFQGQVLIMQSNGGVMAPALAKEKPVAMLESGPVGGFIAAARVGGLLGHANVIAFDMGGTTAKTNLITDGEPRMAHGYHIGGYARGQPVMLPVVDTVEVGSGGGSIAWVDEVGSLKVGPRSAGADPGPICYGRGGTEPTVTDANLVLGRLGERTLLGGEMTLDVPAATTDLRSRIADHLGLSVVEAALAITKVAVMKMSLAVREVSVERGYDPRDFAMVAFGGAGPLHAVEVARELHIPTIVVPNVPGQFSAAGMLIADLKHDTVRTYYKELDLADFDELGAIVDGLADEGRQRLLDEGVTESRMQFQRLLEIRYAGQDFAIPITVSPDVLTRGERQTLHSAFSESHQRQFGYQDHERPLEIVNVRVIAVGRREARNLLDVEPSGGAEQQVGTRPVFFESVEDSVETPVHQREKLPGGFRIDGPSVIQEYGSTTILFPGDIATVAATGELVIQVRGAVT